jgi:hypothetical protein
MVSPVFLLACFYVSLEWARLFIVVSIFLNGWGTGMIMPGFAKNIEKKDIFKRASQMAASDAFGACTGVFLAGLCLPADRGYAVFLVYILLLRLMLALLNMVKDPG